MTNDVSGSGWGTGESSGETTHPCPAHAPPTSGASRDVLERLTTIGGGCPRTLDPDFIVRKYDMYKRQY